MSWALSLWAGVAVFGFALVFSVPRRTLPGIALLAIGAHLLRSLLMSASAGLPLASFGAAAAVGLSAAMLSPRMRQATPIYAFAPVIPLIPGTYMFDALTGVLALTSNPAPPDPGQIVVDAAVNTVTATLTIIALAVGAIGPSIMISQQHSRHHE